MPNFLWNISNARLLKYILLYVFIFVDFGLWMLDFFIILIYIFSEKFHKNSWITKCSLFYVRYLTSGLKEYIEKSILTRSLSNITGHISIDHVSNSFIWFAKCDTMIHNKISIKLACYSRFQILIITEFTIVITCLKFKYHYNSYNHLTISQIPNNNLFSKNNFKYCHSPQIHNNYPNYHQ